MEIKGVLKRHPFNSRYFSDDGERAVYLTGLHTWANFQDILLTGSPEEILDYDAYLDAMHRYHHNFIRLWMFENAAWAPWTKDIITWFPLPYARTGPGTALDGEPRFNLDLWNEEYFERLRDRVIKAGTKGIYVSVMLFEGWSKNKPVIQGGGKPWDSHPFNQYNNINGVNGEIDNTDGLDAYSLNIPSIVSYQEAYVRKVIDTVNDLDNVLYEIINEIDCTEDSCRWQYHFINYIHHYEASMPKQHPVGMTIPWDGINKQDNAVLFNSPADWISPFSSDMEDYRSDPPQAEGKKVVITDTDHLWGYGGNQLWVWKSFLRGLNPIFMDPWLPIPGKLIGDGYFGSDLNRRDYPDWEPIRKNMGYTLRYAQRMDLASMTPRRKLASTGYCLANPGYEYLVFLPDTNEVGMIFEETNQRYNLEWFEPCSGTIQDGGQINCGGVCRLTSPFEKDAVLYIRKI
jgi:hypothetical protein